MRKFMLAISIMLSMTLAAQDSTVIFIEAGRDVSEVLTPDKIYQIPKFVKGKILFRDGTWSEGMLNYNLLNGEIEFIGPANDTLAIAKNQMLNIKEVSVDTLSFFYNKGYLELVAETDFGKLYRKQMFIVRKREKIGGYNQPSSTTAIESYGNFTDNNGSVVTGLKVKENITLVLRTDYFISNQFEPFLPATKRNMMKLYHSKENQIESYLKINTVDFKNGKNLKKMFESL